MRLTSRLLGLLLVILTACGQAPTPNTPTPEVSPTALTTVSPVATTISSTEIAQMVNATPTPPSEPGTIRIVHAAPDTPDINLITGVQAIATNLAYSQTTEPINLEAGEYPVTVVTSGSRPNDPALLETSFTLQGGEALVLVIAKEGEELTLVTFAETVEPLNPSESIVTLFNAVSGADDAQISQETNPIPFGESATTDALTSGDTTLTLQAGDFNQPYDIALEAGRHYTLVLTGSPDNLTAISFSTESPGSAAVRAINASDSLSAFDVYMGNTLIAGNAASGRPTSRQNTISGQYEVSVYEAGADRATAQALVSQTVEVQPGESTAMLVLGTESNLTILPFVEDLSPTPPNKARIAFVNTLPDVPTLHIETSGGPLPEVPDMGFRAEPGQALLSADSHNLYFTRVGNSNENLTVETIQNIQLEAGMYYLLLVTGREDNQPVILSEEVGIDESLPQNLIEQPANQDSSDPAQFHFINAMRNQMPIDFRINDMLAASVAYGQGSELVPVNGGDTTISVTIPNSDEVLQFVQDNYESGKRYSILAYGTDESDLNLMLLSDDGLIFDGRTPYLRLINVSLSNDSSIGLAFSTQDTTPQGETTSEPIEDLRRSIPYGLQRLVENILGGTASPVILMPTGIFDMEILDTITNQLAMTVYNVNLEANRHYDIIVYEEQDTTRIRAFVVQYPADSGS